MLFYFNKEVSSAWLLEEDILLGGKKKKLLNKCCTSWICFLRKLKQILLRASLVAQMVKNLPAMWKIWVWSLGWKYPLEEGNLVFWPGEFYRLYSPWGHKKSDTTERLPLSLSGCEALRPLGCWLTILMSICYIFLCSSL